jgi:RimJ/RimL family protein N-acetyltransferase
MHIFLQTERLVMRRFTAGDVDNLCALDGDSAVMRYLNGGKPTPRDVIQHGLLPWILSLYERYDSFGRWAAIERSTGDFLGWLSLRPPDESRPEEVELGYRLRQAAWGKGYATEGARALIHKGFAELGVQRVVAHTMTVNTASRRVMEKAGLTFVRTFYEDWPEVIEGGELGDVEYALTRAEWERQNPLSPRGEGAGGEAPSAR